MNFSGAKAPVGEVPGAEATVLCDIACELGEGPAYDRHTDTLWWFDIANRKLFEKQMKSGALKVHDLPEISSAIARIDDQRQLLVTETGAHVRDIATGRLTRHVGIEVDNPATRSNDARVHPSGAFWIGTMAKNHDKGAGAIYWLKGSELRLLYPNISIPNAICFSPDGSIAYFTDSADNRLMRVACDAATGLPKGEPAVWLDGRGGKGVFDGSVCDADGNVWNARWGAARLDCYAPDGKLLRSYSVGARQSSCPAFVGDGGIAVTSAWQGMNTAARAADPMAGFTFLVAAGARPRYEPDFEL